MSARVPFKLEVVDIENRGTAETPFGFVYFNDDTRLGWAPGLKDTEATGGFFPGNWGGNTKEHIRLAQEAVANAFMLEA